MHALLAKLRLVRRDTSGVTAIEYGLIAGAIAVVIIVAVGEVGGSINDRFISIRDALAPAAAPPPPPG